MSFFRVSAVETFGVPLASPADAANTKLVVRLLQENNAELTEIEPGTLEDITPPYWRSNLLRTMISLPRREGPLTVEFLPVNENSDARAFTMVDSSLLVAIGGIRTITIPNDQEAFVLAGGSPRYPGTACVHELVAYTRDI